MSERIGCVGDITFECTVVYVAQVHYHDHLKASPKINGAWLGLTEFRQPLQVQSHLEMPRILVQLGHTQRT